MATTMAMTTTPMPRRRSARSIARRWGAGILGVVIGLVIAFCFVLATAAPG